MGIPVVGLSRVFQVSSTAWLAIRFSSSERFALMGHMSRAILEWHSPIRMVAKLCKWWLSSVRC
jgi:hypothetical protein